MAPARELPSTIPEYPTTEARKPPPAGELQKALGDAGQPRANRAATIDKPEGSKESPDNRTVLQQHCDFFDNGNKGFLWPSDTYIGFRKIGFGRIISFLAIFFIHGSFSYFTQPGWLPDPFFRIYTNTIHKTKHGSDSETYDTEGRMVPQKLEDMFSKYGDGESLTGRQIWEATEGNRNIMDPVGWTAEKLEWGVTWWLLKDADGKLSKEKARGCIDGTIFYQLVEEKERNGTAVFTNVKTSIAKNSGKKDKASSKKTLDKAAGGAEDGKRANGHADGTAISKPADGKVKGPADSKPANGHANGEPATPPQQNSPTHKDKPQQSHMAPALI